MPALWRKQELPLKRVWLLWNGKEEVWSSEWKIVMPGNSLLSDADLGIDTFIRTVKDIKLHLETYSYSGN